jgi:phage gp45-like
MSIGKRLYDRLIATVGLGRGTTAADGGSPIQQVQVIFVTTSEIRDGVQMMQQYGFASRPHAGCDYAALTLSGDPTKSLVIASNDQRYRLTLAEGEVGIHDDQGQSVHITRTGINISDKSGNSIVTSPTGIVQTDASGSVITMAAGGIALSPQNGIVTVNGQITGTGNGGVGMSITGSIGATGDVTAGVGGTNIGLLNLKVSGITPGSGDSGIPVPNT